MIKIITIIVTLLSSYSIYAQESDLEIEIQNEAVKELERINNEKDSLISRPETILKENCSNCTDGKLPEKKTSNVLMSPLKAIEEANNEPLKYMGRILLATNEKNYSCLYENNNVIVIYNNCTSDKKEVRAQEILILSKNGGMIRFYNNLFKSKEPHSKVKRSEYDGTWTIDWKPTPKLENANLSRISQLFKELKENNSKTLRENCFIGKTFEAPNKTATAECPISDKFNYEEFKSSSESFWSNPPQLWYDVQNKIRKLVVETKY